MPKRAAGGKSGGDVAKKPKLAKSNHKLADPLPLGEVLKDVFKREWKIGPSIGSGGFGLLYLASSDISKTVDKNAEYVVKCEPHSNGPLFCELHFYQRVAKAELIDEWMKTNKLKSLGVPRYIGAGSHERTNCKYRFLVMERFSTDLQKLFENNRRSFPRKTVLMLATRILHTLEFIHSKDYVHADVKASNLLLGFKPATRNQVFLVDYGLAAKYKVESGHKEYKEDPRKVHDGTIEFTSRDAHKGVAPSRRGDLEILGYCLLQWLCGTLPWEKNLNNKDWVRDQKIKYFSNIPSLMKECFPSQTAPEEISDYLKLVAKLGYDEKPDYKKLRGIFEGALKKSGWKDDGMFEFSAPGADGDSPRKGTKKRKSDVTSPTSPRKKIMKKSPIDSPAKSRTAARPKKSSAARLSPDKLTPKRKISTASPKSTSKRKATPNRKIPIGSPQSSPRHKALNIPKSILGPKTVKTLKDTPKESAIKKKKKVLKELSEVATQTSPGLKGLPRSRKSR